MADKSPSMGAVLKYAADRKSSSAEPKAPPSSPAPSAPAGDSSGLPDVSESGAGDDCVVCEKCGHENRKKESERLELASSNFDTREP